MLCVVGNSSELTLGLQGPPFRSIHGETTGRRGRAHGRESRVSSLDRSRVARCSRRARRAGPALLPDAASRDQFIAVPTGSDTGGGEKAI